MKPLGDVHRVYVGLAIVCMAIPAAQLARLALERDDIWWTPRERALTLEDSRRRVEVYIDGSRLEQHVAASRLLLAADPGPRAVRPQDVSFRFNNRDQVKASRIPGLIVASGVLGMGATMLVLFTLGWVPDRPDKQPRNTRKAA
jgi:hypothetical protein